MFATAQQTPARPRGAFSRGGVIGAMALTLGLTLGLAGTANALASPVPEGDARNFAILAGSTVTNANLSTVTGDIGLHPGTAITGYGPGANQITHIGEVHATNAVALDAKNALTGAYNNAAAQGTEFTIDPDLAGTNLVPGVYDSTSGAFGLSGTMTLTGDSSSIFIFKMTSALTTSSGSTVVLAGDVSPCNVYWQVGSSATLGTGSSFVGTVMADQSISMNSSATLQGRLWARIGQVSLDNNTIANPCFAAGATGPGTGVDTGEVQSAAQVPNAPSGGVATGDGSTLATNSGLPAPLGATFLIAALMGTLVVARSGWRRHGTLKASSGRDRH